MQGPEFTVGRRIDISLLTPMPKVGEANGPTVVELTDEQRAVFDTFGKMVKDEGSRLSSQAEQLRQEKAHTVFTVDGKVVALQQENGWSTFMERRFADMGVFDKEPAHLFGKALADYRAGRMEAAFRSEYSDALEVHSYSGKPNAPTVGQLAPALWEGKSLHEALSSHSASGSLLALTGRMLSLLNEQ